MAEHQSNVNFRNLIRDLAEMYPSDVADVVIVELVANALDAKATRISIQFDPSKKRLVVSDNGTGMSEDQFGEYHDFAAGLKTRGQGIGFAGVGAKISFNVADRVLTETRSDTFEGGSDWHMKSNRTLAWEDRAPDALQGIGTRVEVLFKKGARLPYSDQQGISRIITASYLPLMAPTFLELYGKLGFYSPDLRFEVNGVTLSPEPVKERFGLDHLKAFKPKQGRKPIGYGVFGISANDYPVATELCGVLLCIRGKVIKSDLFNQFPGTYGPRIFGLVEVPKFIQFLTTSKTDFIRGRGIHKKFEALYGPIREEFKEWLAEVGVTAVEASAGNEARRLERELKKVLDAIPELSEFLGFRAPKQVPRESSDGETGAEVTTGAEPTFPDGEGTSAGGAGPLDEGEGPGEALTQSDDSGGKRAEPVTRRARRGPKVGFVSASDRTELAWVEGNQILINEGHPCYVKTPANSRERRLVCLFAIGCAVQRFMIQPESEGELMLVDRLMKAWAEA